MLEGPLVALDPGDGDPDPAWVDRRPLPTIILHYPEAVNREAVCLTV